MKGGKKEADQLDTSVFRNNMVVASLDFLFASYPKLRMEGVSNLEMLTDTDKINPKKKTYFSIKK